MDEPPARLGIGAGDQGNTSISAATAPGALGQWINLLTQNANSPANAVIIDSFGGPADFYVDEASIVAVP